jgi:hypothetical protein
MATPTRPSLTTTVVPTTVNGRSVGVNSSKVYTPMTAQNFSISQLSNPDGTPNMPAISLALTQFQQNVTSATLPARSDPHTVKKIVQAVSMTAGSVSPNPMSVSGSHPAVTITGFPQFNGTLLIQIQTGGALGTATFQWSVNDGQTWAASNVLTGAHVSLGVAGVGNSPGVQTNLVASFASGTYVSTDTYSTTATVTPVTIRHGLGQAPTSWGATRVYANSTPFNAAEAVFGSSDWPSTSPLNQYIVLYPACTGMYDVYISPNP